MVDKFDEMEWLKTSRAQLKASESSIVDGLNYRYGMITPTTFHIESIDGDVGYECEIDTSTDEKAAEHYMLRVGQLLSFGATIWFALAVGIDDLPPEIVRYDVRLRIGR